MGRSLPFKVCFAMLARQSYAYVFRQVAQSLCSQLSRARSALPPFAACSLTSKLSRPCCGLYGKVGRAITKLLHLRAHSSVFRSDISPAIWTSLRWWRDTLQLFKFSRTSPTSPLVVSLSDGEGTSTLGVALWSSSGAFRTRCTAPAEVPPLWPNAPASANHINAIESSGPLLLIYSFEDIFHDCLWVHWIDNNGALACLVNGHSDG